MHRERLVWLRLGAVASDAVVLAAAWTVAVVGRAVLPDLVGSASVAPLEPALALPLGWLVVPLWLLSLGWRGAYQALRRKTAATVVGEITAATVVAAVAATALVFAARLPLNRTLLVGFAVLSVPALAACRAGQAAVLHALRRRAFDPYRVVVLGDDDAVQPVQRAVDAHPAWGMIVHAHLRPGDEVQLAELLATEPVDEVIVAGSWPPDRLVPVARAADELGVPLSLDATFLGLRAHRVELQQLDGWTAMTFRSAGPTLERMTKRALDLGVATVGLALFGPVLLALAAWVRAADGGPAFFVQQRVGQFGRTFRMVKLRTMVPDANLQRERLLGPHNARDPSFKLARNPRITPVGRWLRRTSLDELPQLLNVLRGEMSLVGPRPPLPAEVSRYARWQLRRLSVRPGMTGLWQVSGRADLPFEAGLDLDLQYIDRWTLWLDLQVLAQTVPAVLKGTGAR